MATQCWVAISHLQAHTPCLDGRKVDAVNDFSGHRPGSLEYRRLLTGLFFAGMATFAQLYAPQAVLPAVADEFDVGPAVAALTVSASTLGLAIAVIPWSAVADLVGRIPAMAMGIVSATIVGAVAPFVDGITALLVLRLVEGIALGAVPAVALAYLSEEIDGRHVAAAAGSYIAGTTVGGLSGRLVSGPFGDLWGWRLGVLSVVVLCAVAAALFLALVPRARGFTPGRSRPRESSAPTLMHRLGANLRSPVQLALYAQGFLLMGAFVAVYNYLGFHLSAPPFLPSPGVVTLLFLAYLAGTVSSPRAGALAARVGRLPVLIGSIIVMAAGATLLGLPHTGVVLGGLIIFTAGFFGAHAVASGWTPVLAVPGARAQASSLYYLGYYGGSSLFGWLLGLVFGGAGWGWFLGVVVIMCASSVALALAALRPDAGTPVRSRA